MHAVLALLLLVLAASPASSSPPPPVAAGAGAAAQTSGSAEIKPARAAEDGLAAAPDLRGEYVIPGVYDGDPTCMATLTGDSAIGGWALRLEPKCTTELELPEEAAVWTVNANGEVLILDDTRKAFRRFTPTAEDDFVSHADGQRSLELQRK